MKIFDAKKRIEKQRIIAATVMIVAMLLLVCAGLKSAYISLNGDTTALSSISHGVQRCIYFVYERTQFISWFWKWAPVVNINELNTSSNFGILFVMVCGAIGRTMWDSASHLSSRIKKTLQRVEELGWEQELMEQNGHVSASRPDVLQINIELDQKDQWHKRPVGLLLVGVGIAILGQWANLQFGLVKS